MIRGVNIGGYLVLERYITPYQFLVTDCHVTIPTSSSSSSHDFCWYPQQLSAPPIHHPHYQQCVLTTTDMTSNVVRDDSQRRTKHTTTPQKYCTPVKVRNAFGNVDYPIDERTLAMAFIQPILDETTNTTNTTNAVMDSVVVTTTNLQSQLQLGAAWLEYHLEYFITYDDLVQLKEANITHLRVPIPHWILYQHHDDDDTMDVVKEEIWIIGKRWEYFLRLCRWARTLQLQVWPDIHTAPGSQNGFDNSGQALPYTTCQVWSNNPEYIEQSLRIIETIAQAIQDDGVADVVTGFGLLNEPYADCIPSHYRHFVQEGMSIVRRILGNDMAVYASDMFQASLFNDGHWYHNTYLDSHYYQVFDSTTRYLSPRQHIAYTCRNHEQRTTSCCYSDGPHRNQHPSRGVSRMIGEWSASMDILPAARINDIISGIVQTGTAPYMDRQLSPERKEFLNNFIQAQIVTYEAAHHPGLSQAWFYWTIKMEGGAFQEWDMLRGLQDGWFPNIVADADTSSESVYGSCYDIMWRTNDNRTNVLEEYPDPQYVPIETDPKKIIDDDVVLSHGESLLVHPNTNMNHNDNSYDKFYTPSLYHQMTRLIVHHWLFILIMALLTTIMILSIVRRRYHRYQKRSKYSNIESEISMSV